MSAASGEKKRRYPRIALPKGMWVAWHDGGRRWASRVQTLGMGGLFINIPDPPVVGTVVKLLFEVPSGEVRAQAIVRNVKPGQGMGVEFRQMAMEDRARLQQLLKRLITLGAAGDAERLRRRLIPRCGSTTFLRFSYNAELLRAPCYDQ